MPDSKPDETVPQVLVTNFDLLHLLDGRAMTFSTSDGGRARIRLYTPDELIAGQHATAGDAKHLKMGREQAESLCQPIHLA